MHENIIDDHLLNLDAEEALLRGALHKAVAEGHTSNVSKLITAQAVLRNTALLEMAVEKKASAAARKPFLAVEKKAT